MPYAWEILVDATLSKGVKKNLFSFVYLPLYMLYMYTISFYLFECAIGIYI